MSIVERYLEGLKQVLGPDSLKELALASGASAESLRALRERYPHCPASLLELLGHIDGTHFRDYPGGRVAVLMLGSGLFEYPYYLRSVQQILADGLRYPESIRDTYEQYLDEYPDIVGPGIDADAPMGERLCFSHCMNNGGSSRLYIDFMPGPGGVAGQVVQFVHDPDNFEVIADSFDTYLQQRMDEGYAFVFEDE